jgi:hypothetical protein
MRLRSVVLRGEGECYDDQCGRSERPNGMAKGGIEPMTPLERAQAPVQAGRNRAIDDKLGEQRRCGCDDPS